MTLFATLRMEIDVLLGSLQCTAFVEKASADYEM
jgi:hypothetical protein